MIRITLLLMLMFSLPLVALERARLPYAFPNPFHTTVAAKVKIVIPIRSAMVSGKRFVDIYDRLGVFIRRLKTVRSRNQFTAVWDSLDREQKQVHAGVYFIRVTTAAGRPYVFSLMLFR